MTAATVRLGGRELDLTVSAGAAVLMPGDGAAKVVERADAALYASKKAGRNCAHYHNGVETLPIYAPVGFGLLHTDLVADADQQQTGPTDVKSDDRDDSQERRDSTRKSYTSRQRVAPYDGREMPQRSAFEEVQCLDLSLSGFSFLASEPPAYEQLVVRFFGAKNLVYVIAQIVNRTQIADDPQPLFRVGCRFSGRLEA